MLVSQCEAVYREVGAVGIPSSEASLRRQQLEMNVRKLRVCKNMRDTIMTWHKWDKMCQMCSISTDAYRASGDYALYMRAISRS
jgi:hypothetical protein